MIRNESVERALHQWQPWVKAVEEARTALSESDAETCYAYAGKALKTLRLPTKLALRVYFLSCVFSSYKHGEHFVFSEIRLPPLEKLKAQWPPYRVEVENWHPLPPAILTKKDVHRLLHDHGYYGAVLGMSLSAAIREIFAPYFMVVNQQHPVRQIGSKIKRGLDFGKAVACATMKESMTYKEIGEKFGWAIQKDAYYRKKRYRCSTAYRYVRLGKKLISNSLEERKLGSVEFLPDSPEQIARSINMAGLRTEIDQAFETAIARVSKHRHRSYELPINETKDVDP